MAVFHDELGHRIDWSASFVRSAVGPDIYEVLPHALDQVLDWAERQPVPCAERHSVLAPAARAWALLDGGVLHVHGYGLTTLPAGGYVIGAQAFRLLLAELGFPRNGLTVGGPDAPRILRRRMQAGHADDPSWLEQADLLAGCTDAVMLRLVATVLRAEHDEAVAPAQ